MGLKNIFTAKPQLDRAVPSVPMTPLKGYRNAFTPSLAAPLTIPPFAYTTDWLSEGGLLGLPAAWRAVNLRSNAVAMMMRHAHVIDEATDTRIETPLIVSRPNVFYGSFNFWSEVVSTVIIQGNYVALITEVDSDGNPLQVTPIHPGNVSVDLSSGFPVYRIAENTYSWRQVVHVRGLTVPGSYWGIGVLAAHMRGLTTAYDQQTYAKTSYSSGGAPSGIISIDTQGAAFPGDDELSRIGSQWDSQHGAGTRKIAIMPNGLKFQPIQWTPEEMQFLASRQFGIAEMALMFNLDPTDLSASIGGQSMTYANIEQREISRNVNTYSADLHRIEDAWSDLLPGEQCVYGNPEALLRMDTKTRYEAHAIGISSGFETIDEARALENRKPLDNAV